MSEKPAARDVNDIEVIAPDGDVILVTEKVISINKFRVSSHVLSKTSPVFRAMFGPNFREGEKLRSSTEPVEVPLPEDDSRDVRMMCQLLHTWQEGHRVNNGSDIIGLRRTAVLLQKYQILDPVYWQMSGFLHYWLHKNQREDNIDMAIEAVAVAYLISDEGGFQRATAHLINKCNDGLTELVNDPTIDIITVRVLLILEARRELARSSAKGNEDAGLCLEYCNNGEQGVGTACGGHNDDDDD